MDFYLACMKPHLWVSKTMILYFFITYIICFKVISP